MSTYREDTRVQIPATHELIYGPVGTGKTESVRRRLTDEVTHASIETWLIDLNMSLPEFAGLADKHAITMAEARTLMGQLLAAVHYRQRKLAEVGAARFEAMDPRHGLPLIVVTIDDAHTVLTDREIRAVMEQIAQYGQKAGVLTRLVAQSGELPDLRAFGYSELIRSTMTAGSVFACEKASA
jgi:soluble cytochrome b562